MTEMNSHPYPGTVLAAKHFAERAEVPDYQHVLESWKTSEMTAEHLHAIESACNDALHAAGNGSHVYGEAERVQLAYAAGFYHALSTAEAAAAEERATIADDLAAELRDILRKIDATRSSDDDAELEELLALLEP